MSEQESLGLFQKAPSFIRFKEYRLDQLPESVLERARTRQPTPGMVVSVRKSGVLQPIILRELPSGRLQLVCGRHRIMASLAAERATIPAVVYTLDSTDAQAMILIENYHRGPSAISEMEAIEALLAKGGSALSIAAELAIPYAAVVRRMKLLRLVPELRAALGTGRMSLGTAEAASGLSKDQQRTLVEKLADEKARILAEDVRALRSAKARAAVASLPAAAFAGPTDPATKPEPRAPVPAARFAKNELAEAAMRVAALEEAMGEQHGPDHPWRKELEAISLLLDTALRQP